MRFEKAFFHEMHKYLTSYKGLFFYTESKNPILLPNKIELLTATDEASAIHKFIEKKGEGIHHIAFAVEDIYSEMSRLKADGFVLLNDVPKKGADNKLVCFVHPKSANGVLVELCQEITPTTE